MSANSSASHIFNSQTIERLKQATKIGIAAVAALYLAQFLGLPESYWATISAIIVIYSDEKDDRRHW